MGSANPLFLKGGPQAIQTPPPLPSSTGGGRSPLRGVLRRIGRPHNGLRIIEPDVVDGGGRHQKRLGPDDGTGEGHEAGLQVRGASLREGLDA